MEPIHLLAISGSLRQKSYNTEALKAIQVLAPKHIKIEIASIANIPLFNPDFEQQTIQPVENLKAMLARSDGLIIASPEYAHGITGVLKNALDWLVSGVEFPGKPIMLINTSSRASIAQDALKEVLTTMSGVLLEESHATIPLLGSQLQKDGIVADNNLASSLTKKLLIFVAQIEQRKRSRQAP